jgi:hypothetical protein
VQRKLLATLNSVLLVVTITYITRAIFVLDLFLEFSGSLTSSYAMWIICTHWMPHLLGERDRLAWLYRLKDYRLCGQDMCNVGWCWGERRVHLASFFCHSFICAGSSCLFYIMSQGSEKKPRGKVYKGEGARRSKGKSKSRGRGAGRGRGSSGPRGKRLKEDLTGERHGEGRSKSSSSAVAGEGRKSVSSPSHTYNFLFYRTVALFILQLFAGAGVMCCVWCDVV